MAKATTESGDRPRAAPPTELPPLLRAVAAVLASLILVWGLDQLGVIRAIDAALQRGYVDVEIALGIGAGHEAPDEAGGPQTDSVVVVAGDHDTVMEWGPPPWSAQHRAAIVARITSADPRQIVELGHPPMFTPDHSRGVSTSPGDGSGEWSSEWSAGGVDLRGIRWLTPRGRLPVIPAHQVALGKVPPTTFAGRVVVLGVTDPDYARPVETPLGLLSPVEVDAHALTSLTSLSGRNAWVELPRAWSYLGCGVLGLVWLGLLARIGSTRRPSRVVVVLARVLVPILTLIVMLALDFEAYEHGWIQLGWTRAGLMVPILALGHALEQGRQAQLGVRRIHARITRLSASDDPPEDPPEDLIEDPIDKPTDEPTEPVWRELAELGAAYAREVLGEPAGSSLIERVAGREMLEPRAHIELPGAVREPSHGLDLRRAPFRAVWLTLRASSTDSSILVPLTDGRELFGLWVVTPSGRRAAQAKREQLERLEALAREMTGALLRRRDQRALADSLDDVDLRTQLAAIDLALDLEPSSDAQHAAFDLLEQLPIRLVIASVWGEIEFIDARLRDELETRWPELFDPGPAELQAVLAQLTGTSRSHAHRLMRTAIHHRVALELDPPTIDASQEVWVLTPIFGEHGLRLPGFRPAIRERLVLMARSAVTATSVETASGAHLRVAPAVSPGWDRS